MFFSRKKYIFYFLRVLTKASIVLLFGYIVKFRKSHFWNFTFFHVNLAKNLKNIIAIGKKKKSKIFKLYVDINQIGVFFKPMQAPFRAEKVF